MKFYHILLKILLTILIFLIAAITPLNKGDGTDGFDIILLFIEQNYDTSKVKFRRAWKPMGKWELRKFFVKMFFRGVLKSGAISMLFAYVVLCTPMARFAGFVGIGVFGLLSIKGCLQYICVVWPCEFCKRILERYEELVQIVMECMVALCLVIIVGDVLDFIVYYLLERLQDFNWMIFFVRGSIAEQTLQNQIWETRLCCGDVKLEESEQYYRISIGKWHWEIFKENEFDYKVFSVLLATAMDDNGDKILSWRDLAKSLGYSHHDLLIRVIRKWEREGKTLACLSHGENKGYHTQLRREILELLKSDCSLGYVEIRDCLIAKGWANVTIEQIQEALAKINYNELHEAIRRQCLNQKAGSDFDSSLPAKGNGEVKIMESGESYRVVWGEVYWDVHKQDRFLLAGLLYHLTLARTHEGKKVTGVKFLARMLGFTWFQDLQKMFFKYKAIADKYRPLKAVCQKISHDDRNSKLRAMIFEIWKENVSLSCNQIMGMLHEKGEKTNFKRMRNVMRSMDFYTIQRHLSKVLGKGKYRLSARWIIQKYQDMVHSLLLKLHRGEKLEKAQIDEYVTQSVRLQPQDKKGERNPPGHEDKIAQPARHWLKCFLFALPKLKGDKICCPHCGSFDTARKSLVPRLRSILNAKSGQNVTAYTFQYRCKNPFCKGKTFTATPDGSHILEECRFAKACLMLRLVMSLRGSYRHVANLLGTQKSFVFNELTLLSEMSNFMDEIVGSLRFSGTVCIDEKFIRIASLKKTSKRAMGYLVFAVDPATYTILHLEIFPSRDAQSAETFLMGMKGKGIYPKVVMTDLADTYDKPICKIYGRSVTLARCFFHFKKNIFDHMNKQFGKNDIPEIATKLKEEIFDVVDAKSRKTIKKRFAELQKAKPDYLSKEPKLEPMFSCLESYLPHLLRVVENERVSIRTNNPCELVIRHFNQRYKCIKRFKNIDTAMRHARLFLLVYHFTPLSDELDDILKRGLCPLELAGYPVNHMPIYQYLSKPILFNVEPAKNLSLLQAKLG